MQHNGTQSEITRYQLLAIAFCMDMVPGTLLIPVMLSLP